MSFAFLKRLKTIAKSSVALALIFLLPSCYDSEEEFWLNADASGAVRIKITLPAAAASLHGGEAGVKTLIENFLKENPTFSSYLVETATEKKQLTVNVAATFENALDLTKSSSPDSLPGSGAEFMGESEVEFQGLNLIFKRRVELSKAFPGALFLPKSKTAGHNIKTTVHLPKAATAHNATSIADGGRTLIWSTPLTDALRKPVKTSFTMPLPIPWAFISFVLFLVVLLFAAIIYYFLRRKKLRTKT